MHTFETESSWGIITINEDGFIVDYDTDDSTLEDGNWVLGVSKFDLVEYCEFMASKGWDISPNEIDCFDVLECGHWTKDGEYHEADQEWRHSIVKWCEDAFFDLEGGIETEFGVVKSIDAYVDGEQYVYYRVFFESQEGLFQFKSLEPITFLNSSEQERAEILQYCLGANVDLTTNFIGMRDIFLANKIEKI